MSVHWNKSAGCAALLGVFLLLAAFPVLAQTHSAVSNPGPVDNRTVPDAPTGVSAVAGIGQVTVSFLAPTDDGGAPVTGYTATVDPGGVTGSGAASPITISGLTPGPLTITVTARNALGVGPASNPSSAGSSEVAQTHSAVSNPGPVDNRTVPDEPTGVSALAGIGQVVVSFLAPTDDGGALITGYTVTASPGGATANGAASPITVSGLAPGPYTFTVTASNALGVGPAGKVLSTVPVKPLLAQSIEFLPLSAQVLTNVPIVLSASASSGLPVTFSLVSGPARLTSGVVTFSGAGSITVRASQGGNGDFAPAADVVRSYDVKLPPDPQVLVSQGTQTSILPWLVELGGVEFAVAKAPSIGAVTFDGKRFLFTPPTTFIGVTEFTYRITDSVSGSTTDVRVFFVVQPASPVFSFEQTSYSVGEGAGFLLVAIRKNVSSPARVGLRLIENSAKRVQGSEGDFSLPVAFFDFDGPETNRRVAVSIVNDLVYEGEESFALELVAETLGASVIPERSKAVVTIVDDDSRTFAPYRKEPAPVPAREAFLSSQIMPTESGGLWRFVGERHWRGNGTVSEALPGGVFEVEFKPVQGYAQALPVAVSVTNGSTRTLDVFYTPAASSRRGDLTVICDGTSLGGWKFEEEPDTAFRPSGTVVANLAAGTYTIEFKPVDGFIPPGIMNVEVTQKNMPPVRVSYVPAPLTGSDRTRPGVLSFGTGNYPFIGHITRGDGEMGSGFVVKERVVLTAGHVVFDQRRLTDARRVRWFFQKHRGVYQPAPQIPRGWIIQDGYASRRTQEGPGSPPTVFAQNLDAAALFFTQPAGRGGSGGFLASTNSRNEWLTGFADAVLSGYPVDGIPRADQEKIHETTPRAVTFNPVLGLPGSTLYRSGDLLSYPGNSGGPLCVRYTDGRFYPAGIFVGVDADNIYVKALDERVVDLMDVAEKLGITSTNATGAGVILPGSTISNSDFDIGVLDVTLAPDTANDAGAGWRLVGGDPAYWVGASTAVPLLGFEYSIEFKPLNGFVTPLNAMVTVVVGLTNRVEARYRRVQSIDFGTTAILVVGGSPLRLSAAATSGLPVRYEVLSGPGNLAGDLLTATALGRIVVRARQDGSDDFAPAFAERSFDAVADTVAPRPMLTFTVADGLRLIGPAGAAYRVEFTDTLRSPVAWETLKEVRIAEGNELGLSTPAATAGSRFYRAVVLP